jgi:protein ImuB
LAKPEPVDVVAELPQGPPQRFRWRSVAHRVKQLEGPERIAMEWWRHQTPQPTRDYFRVEDEEGRRYWLYRDAGCDAPRWFLQGIFA